MLSHAQVKKNPAEAGFNVAHLAVKRTPEGPQVLIYIIYPSEKANPAEAGLFHLFGAK